MGTIACLVVGSLRFQIVFDFVCEMALIRDVIDSDYWRTLLATE